MIISGLFFIPLERINVADLQPVRAVQVSREGDRITLETDLGQKGSGESLKDALNNLKRNSVGIVYLKTTEYLLVTNKAENLLVELGGYFGRNTRVYIGNASGQIAETAQYLSVHGHLPKLKKYLA